MLELIRQALARNNGVIIARVLTAGQKIPNERAIIAADEIGVAIGEGGQNESFFVQPWTSITWIDVG